MKQYKKIFVILICIITIFTVYRITKTYSLFESEIASRNRLNVGNWTITINNQDVVSGSTHNFNITSDYIYIPRNVHLLNGKIAPGHRGAFSIDIAPVDTQVSIRYDIEINESLIPNSSITVTSVSSRGTDLIKTDEYKYTGLILLEDITSNTVATNQVAFAWVNDENNNENDTNIGIVYNNSINIPVTVTITQYTGEVITPYVEPTGDEH